MGLLTIIRKNRQKEREMRVLFLYALIHICGIAYICNGEVA